MTFRTRGVHYFEGRIRCPLAGVGSRGDFLSNRIVLDDEDSVVTVDREKHRIEVRNEKSYETTHMIADLLWLADGTTASGAKTPLAIHLEIKKKGRKLSVDLHRHLRIPDPLVAVDFEPFTVVVSDGATERVLLTPERATRLCLSPSFGLRIVKSFMALEDHGASEGCVADLSVGFKFLRWKWLMARARLRPLGAPAAAHARDMLRDGAWELSLTALSEKWLPSVVKRDLFLFGLDEVPLLADVRARGLRAGQTMSFRFERGRGSIGLDGAWAEMPAAVDVARAYLEMHMLGGLLAEHAEQAA